jgi:pimeloyl-ACP methyl ester carboxylesterase
MSSMEHVTLDVGGVRIHAVAAGSGPLVLFVHGFPESWYSWRHQLPAVAAAGYRAVAIDVRGYGRSSKPAAIDAYRLTALAGDCAGVVRALGESSAVIVGHDWGAPISWTAALLHPEVFSALATLSVPFAPRGAQRPSDAFAAMAAATGEEFYISYFQQPGRAEAEIESDVRRWLTGFYFSASGDAPPLVPGRSTLASIAPGGQMLDKMSWPASLPGWLAQEDLDFYVGEFERTGFTGGLNRYRNVDRDWEELVGLAGAQMPVPYLFIGGSKDGPTLWGAPAIAAFGMTAPHLWRSVILDGVGHWTQQERPDEVNALLIEFLASLSSEH